MKEITLYGQVVKVKVIDGTHVSFINSEGEEGGAWHLGQLTGTPAMDGLKGAGLTDGYFIKKEFVPKWED